MGGIEWREMVDIELGVLGYDEEMWYHQVRYSQGIWGQIVDSSTGTAGSFVILDPRVGKLKGKGRDIPNNNRISQLHIRPLQSSKRNSQWLTQ